MVDDLFTYEVKIHGISFIPCGKQQVDDSDDGDLDEQRMCQNENESLYAEAVIFVKEKLLVVTRNNSKNTWKSRDNGRGEDEVVLGDEELLDLEDENLIDENEIVKIFRIKTNIFNFETPLCKVFNDFNYILKIDIDLLTNDISRFKTYDEFKNE
nr:hypothetical protein [Tanacetum cinerariifolium]